MRGSRLRRVTALGLAGASVGFAVLFLTALAQVATDPNLTLADAYWIGPLPWTPMGIGLVVAGSTVAVVFGSIAAWLRGNADRRVASGLGLAIALSWWLLALLPPPKGAYCADCPAPTPDPLTYAYSLPQFAIVCLALPAALIGLLVLIPARRPTPGP
jgi:hypothetical protein